MRNSTVDFIKLKENDYALVTENQIIYALDATSKELEKLKESVLSEMQLKKRHKKDADKIPSLAFIITNDCNLNCIYCYANSGGNNNLIISSDIVTKAIKYVKKTNSTEKELNLFLVGGGEPLLYFEKVKEILELAQASFKTVYINVVTNGTFNEEILEWLIFNKASIRISYDGEYQEEQRPSRNGQPQSNIIKNNIKKLIAADNEPMIQSVVTSKNINDLSNLVDMLVDLGVKVMKIEPCLMTDISRGNLSLQPDPKEFANKLIEVIEYIADNNLPLLLDTGYFSKPSNANYCGINSGNFTVTPSGMVTPCVEISKKDDPYADKLMIGEINNRVHINIENLQYINKIGVDNQIGGCCACNLKKICKGGCPMANIWQNGLPLKKSSFTCAVEKIFIPKLLSLMIIKPHVRQIVLENHDICE